MNKQELDNTLRMIDKELKEQNLKITRDYIRKYHPELEKDIRRIYGSYTKLYEELELNIPEVPKRVDATISLEGKAKKYIISSVIEGAPINMDFFNCLQHYCDITNSQLILLWMRGVNRSDCFTFKEFKLLNPFICTEIKLNDNLKALDTQAYPTKRNPLTNLQYLCSKKHSLIIASPKQFLESIPRPRGVIPHILLSTGTISEPKYNKNESGYLAQEYNKLGAVIVEIENNEIFYARQIQYKNKGFVDLGIKYYVNKTEKVPCEAMILGDLHIGQHSDNAVKISIDQINTLKPKKVFLHDMCDFLSINHHEFNKPLALAKKPEWARSLENELKYVKEYLNKFCNKIKSKIYVVHSNHSDFLEKWLNTHDFMNDSINIRLGIKFFSSLLDNKNPIKEYLNNKKLIFLPSEAQMEVEKYLVSQHGHLGINGARGNIKSLAKIHNNIIIGHIHQPRIYNNAIAVGTNSHITMNYTNGPTSWLHANCAIYKGGYTQLYIEVNNKWKK